jgi:hypothetical protein
MVYKNFAGAQIRTYPKNVGTLTDYTRLPICPLIFIQYALALFVLVTFTPSAGTGFPPGLKQSAGVLSQWSGCLRCGSAAVRSQGLRVRISPG